MNGNKGNAEGTPDRGRAKVPPLPDKDWYRKWQERLHRKEKHGSR